MRSTGSGRHTGTINGSPPTDRQIIVDAISIRPTTGHKIAETRKVWDTLGLLHQLGIGPAAA